MLDHARGLVFRHWREPHGEIAVDLGQHAAHAEHHHRAHLGIVLVAENDLRQAFLHALHQHALDAGVFLVSARVHENLRACRRQFLAGCHVEPYRARFGLVRDVRRQDLRHHREFQFDRLFRRLDRLGRGGRHAQRVEHAAGLLFVQAELAAEERARGGDAFRVRRRCREGRAPVAPGADRVGARFRRAEAGNVGLGHELQRGVGLGRAENRERLAAARRFQDRVDRNVRLELRRASHHRQHQVAMIGGEQLVQHPAVDLLLCAGEREVGQARARDLDLLLRQVGDHGCGGRHHLHAERSQPVHNRRRAAAGGGQGRHAVARRRLPAGDQGRQLEQRFQQVHAQHAVGAEKRVRHVVGAGHGPGMGGRELDADVGASELEHDHRLAGGVRAPRAACEAVGVADGFHEQQDHARFGIVRQQVGDLAHREVGLVAHRHQLGEARAAAEAARHQRAHHAAALRDDGGRAGPDLRVLEHGVDREHDVRMQVEQADAVGPEQPHAARPCELQ